MRSKGRSATEALAQISDVVRLTFTYRETAYTDGRAEGSGTTRNRRVHPGRTAQYLGIDQYKGINTRWREPNSGVIFEVQFHTQASLEAKELTHGAYERIRSID